MRLSDSLPAALVDGTSVSSKNCHGAGSFAQAAGFYPEI